jgi:hypothetical protein
MGELREVEMTEIQELKLELQWAIENGMHGPRTELALRWALEAIEALELEGEKG